MTPAEAKQILEVLAGGVDPGTGGRLPDDNPLSSPHVIRALFIAIKALESTGGNSLRPLGNLPEKAGKAWNEDEDKRLLIAFDAGTSPRELALAHGRTRGAINSRLIRLGRLQVIHTEPSD